MIAPSYFINYSSMQTIIDETISELQRLLECAKRLQNRYLTEIMFLQKATNSTLKSNPYIPSRQLPQKQLQKNEIPLLSVQDKAAALISLVETRQRDIESEKVETKPKFQTKLPEIIPEKKPPLPTANRNEKALKNYTPAYVPPRNKNEVTGKVTQTVMRTSAQKVFKPERTSAKKYQPIKKADTSSQTKNRSSAQKIEKVEKKEVQISTAAKQPSQEPIHTESKVEKIKIANSQKQSFEVIAKNVQVKPQVIKEKKFKLAVFHKTIDQILQQILGDGPKNNRFQLGKKLNDCQNQEKGHKMREQQSRKAFIKKSYNYAVSRQKVYPMTSFQTMRKKWTYHPQLFDLRDLLNNLQNQLADLELQKDCRIDKKTSFRISQSQAIYKQRVQQIRSDFQESKSNVPEKIDMNFSFKSICQTENVGDELADWYQLSEEKVNENLLDLLQEIKHRPTLQAKQLRGLQVLTQIGTFRSKRAPVILLNDDYSQWKSYYQKKTQ